MVDPAVPQEYPIEVMVVRQTTRRDRRDVEADLMHARAAREAAVGRHDVESLADMTAWIDQLRVELATLVPAQRRV